MESTQLFNLLQSYLEQLPSFLALIAGIVFAITRWKQHPRVAMVVVIALVYLFLHFVVFTIVYNVVPRWVISSSGSYRGLSHSYRSRLFDAWPAFEWRCRHWVWAVAGRYFHASQAGTCRRN